MIGFLQTSSFFQTTPSPTSTTKSIPMKRSGPFPCGAWSIGETLPSFVRFWRMVTISPDHFSFLEHCLFIGQEEEQHEQLFPLFFTIFLIVRNNRRTTPARRIMLVAFIVSPPILVQIQGISPMQRGTGISLQRMPTFLQALS